MTTARRSTLAALVAALIPLEAAPALAQDPPRPGQAGARGKAAPKRPARRRPRGQAPVGLIVPYPFPAALVIRQTPEAHEEVQALLNLLRGH